MIVSHEIAKYLILLFLSLKSISALSDTKFDSKILQLHNNFRAKHGSSPLTLDDVLKVKAKKLVKTAVDEKGFNEVTAGESVYEVCATFKVVVSPRQVVKSWYDEVCQDGVNFAKNKYDNAESFTQLVWKDSKRIGVARATGKKGKLTCTYVAAVYRPPGNIEEFFAENVVAGSVNRNAYCNDMKRSNVHNKSSMVASGRSRLHIT